MCVIDFDKNIEATTVGWLTRADIYKQTKLRKITKQH